MTSPTLDLPLVSRVDWTKRTLESIKMSMFYEPFTPTNDFNSIVLSYSRYMPSFWHIEFGLRSFAPKEK